MCVVDVSVARLTSGFWRIHERPQMVLLLFMTEPLLSNNLSIVCVPYPTDNFRSY